MKLPLLARAGLLLVLVVGCRATSPELQPPTEKEILVTPPSEARYNNPTYPSAAFRDRNRGLKGKLDDLANPALIGAGPRGGNANFGGPTSYR